MSPCLSCSVIATRVSLPGPGASNPILSMGSIYKMDSRKDIDLNLLYIFEALMETRSVSRASEKLGITQPSMSYALAKMRVAFSDPLFIRVKNEMQPSMRAVEMAAQVSQILNLARGGLYQPASFDPSTCTRVFTLGMTDIGETAYLPHLVEELGKIAPLAKIRTVSPILERREQGLESGAVDLLVGYFPDVKNAEVIQQRLMRTSGFIGVARKGHPAVHQGTLALDDFIRARHIAVRTEGRSQEMVERAMSAAGISRNVVVTVPTYLSLLTVVPATDLISVVPKDFAMAMSHQWNVTPFELPFPCPSVEVLQLWHRRSHEDAAFRWLRDMMRRLFQQDELPPVTPGR